MSSTSPVRRLLAVAWPQRWRLALGALLGALAVGCAVALLATSAWLISQASLRPPILTLEVAIVGVRAFGIGRGVFRYAERLVSHDAVFRTLTTLRVQVYDRLARLGPAGVPAFRRGDLLTRLVDDVDGSQDLYLRAMLPGITAALVGAGAVVLATSVLPAAGAVLLLALLVGGIVVPWLTTWAGRRAERATAAVRGDLSSEVVDVLSGAGDLLVYGGAHQAVAAARATDVAYTRLAARSARAAGLAAAVGQLASGAAVVGSLIVGIAAVRDDTLDGVMLAVVVLLPLAAYEAVVGLPAAALAMARTRAGAARVYEVVDAPLVVHEPAEPAPLPEGPRHLVARDLRARWTPDGPPALDGVDLDLPPGHRVAVVGTSGAGKSTLASVLLRFLDHEGAVTLDGTDLADLADDDVRHVITALTQDPHVFDTTVAENLRLARREASDDDLVAALERVRLGDWFADLPHGLDTSLGAHGTGLSGGEAQRLALARVLLADRAVVVLDEPTEHLDPETADALTADLLELTRGRSTVVVTHRLVGLEDVDEVLVLDHGRVVARGSHDALLAADGDYARRWRREVALRDASTPPTPSTPPAPAS